MERTHRRLDPQRDGPQLPLLGVCYGHQLMAYALGGLVDNNPRGVERGQQQVTTKPGVEKDPLLSQLPSQFPAWLSHQQSVLQAPEGAQLLQDFWQQQRLPERNSSLTTAAITVSASST